MALLWIDGFEKYGSTGALDDVDSNVEALRARYTVKSPYRLYIVSHDDGKALRFDGNAFVNIYTPQLTTDKTLIVGFAFRFSGAYDDGEVVKFIKPYADGAYNENAISLAFIVDTTTELQIRLGSSTLNETSSLDLSEDTWYYAEVKMYCDDSSGTCNVKLNGTEVLNYSGDTSYGSYDFYSSVSFTDGASSFDIDDLYVCDGTGNTFNDFQGTCNVTTLTVNADASGNWTPSTGNDMYAMVDEDALDSNYIKDNTSGNQAIFELENSNTAQKILAVSVVAETHLSGNLQKYAKVITQNGTGNINTEGNLPPGREKVITIPKIMTENPDGDSWDSSTINSLRVGVEVS